MAGKGHLPFGVSSFQSFGLIRGKQRTDLVQCNPCAADT